MASRKVTFHIIKFLQPPANTVIYKDFDFQGFVDWFDAVNDEEKIFNLTQGKFTSLDFIEKIPSRLINSHQKAYFGMMSTGNFGSRRNLKDSITNGKRENPKEIHEGEEQENYFILGFKNGGDVDLILQNAGRGIKSVQFKNYLDKYFNKYLSHIGKDKEFRLLEGSVVETMDIMIDKLDRVTKTRIYADKSILSDDGLGYSERTLSAREDLYIDVRAQRGQDIRDFLQDLRQKIVYKTSISKLWVEGKDNYGNISQFYVDQINKSTFITVDIDPLTASLIKDDMRRELIKLL